MKKILLIVNLIVLLTLTQITGKAQVLRLANSSVNDRPQWLFDYCQKNFSGRDSFHLFKTMDSVRNWAVNDGDERLVWYIDLFQTVFLSYKRKPLSAKQLLLSKKQYFESAPYQEIKGGIYFFLGSVYYLEGDLKNWFYYYIYANDIFESVGYNNVPLSPVYCFSFFGLYYHVSDYPSAIRTLKVRISNNHSKNQRDFSFDYNNLGVSYVRAGELEKAQGAFQKSFYFAKQIGETIYQGIASGNYGNALRLQGHYKQALSYLYTDIALNKDSVPSNCAISCIYIADALLHLDSLKRAESYLNYALRLNPDWEGSNFSREYYVTRSLYFRKTANYKAALLYQDSLLHLGESIKPVNDIALFKAVELKFREDKALAEQHEKELERSEILRNRRLIIASSLLLVFGVTLYFYKRLSRERITFKRRQCAEEEKLQLATLQLEEYIEAIKEKNKVIERIEASIEKSQEGSIDKNQENSEVVQKFSDHPLLTENDWQEFKALFTLVHPQFFTSLHTRYPELSNGEIRVLSLCKLHISSQEMANMLGISLQSLRTSRYRLRKKYPNLPEDEDFKGFI